MKKTRKNLKKVRFMDCDPKTNNISKVCDLNGCSYYDRCKPITKKKYNKLTKKMKIPKLFKWFF
jgi:hypothetical protein